MTTKDIPPIVAELSRRVKLDPMEWRITDEIVSIVFTTGQKIVFTRDDLAGVKNMPPAPKATKPIEGKYRKPTGIGYQPGTPISDLGATADIRKTQARKQ